MRTHCAYCGKRLTLDQHRYCSEDCRKQEAIYHREYQRNHKRVLTDEQTEAARARTREWKRKKQELCNKQKPAEEPKEKPVSLHRMYPHPWWRGGDAMGIAPTERGAGYE